MALLSFVTTGQQLVVLALQLGNTTAAANTAKGAQSNRKPAEHLFCKCLLHSQPMTNLNITQLLAVPGSNVPHLRRSVLLQEDSERLQQETREAASAGLAFGDLRDLRPLLAAAADGIALQPFHLHAVAATLDAAAALRARVEGFQTPEGSQTPGLQRGALRALARGIGDAMPELRHEIWRCIHPEEV